MRFIAAGFILLCLSLCCFAQKWPGKIDGYKLHDAKIVVTNGDVNAADSAGDAVVSVGIPKVIDFGLGGITFEIPAEFVSRKESGSVDFVTFRKITVNGLAIDVDEYRHAFDFKKGKSTALPKPAKVAVRTTALPRAALNELMNTPTDVSVTGTAFVFGRFKKFGFTFKRVVPVTIDLKFPNPISSKRGK